MSQSTMSQSADLTPERQLQLIKLARREIVSLAELIQALGNEISNLKRRVEILEGRDQKEQKRA